MKTYAMAFLLLFGLIVVGVAETPKKGAPVKANKKIMEYGKSDTRGVKVGDLDGVPFSVKAASSKSGKSGAQPKAVIPSQAGDGASKDAAVRKKAGGTKAGKAKATK
jgi:hypothetical protein